jgi:hypothetical protein
MKKVFGPRTALEAVVLVAVPVLALLLGQGPWVIIAASAVAYLGVFVTEAVLGRRATPVEPAPEPVAVAAPEPEPAAAEPADEPELEPEPEPEPVAEVEPVRILRPVPAPPPEPVPDPRPDPGPDPGPEQLPPAAEAEVEDVAEPAAAAVVPIGVGGAPRQWNLWDLERLSREHSGRDDARDEERSYLLIYLRDFAGPDGLLPIDFDGLVRDSFGDVVGARGGRE